MVLPASRSLLAVFSPIKLTPAARSFSISALDWSSARHAAMLSAVVWPMSRISIISSTGAASSASRLPKWFERILPAFWPTCRIPNANSSRDRSRCLLASMLRTRLFAQVSTFLPSGSSCSTVRPYRSAADCTSPASISFCRLPPRRSRRCPSRRASKVHQVAQQLRRTRRTRAADCSFLLIVKHRCAAHRAEPRHFKGLRIRRTLVLVHADDLRDDLARLRTDTVSPTRTSSWRMKSRLCSVARDTVVPASRTGSSTALGVSTPVRPTEMTMSFKSVCLTSGGYLYAAAQRGNLAVEPRAARCANELTLTTAPSISKSSSPRVSPMFSISRCTSAGSVYTG